MIASFLKNDATTTVSKHLQIELTNVQKVNPIYKNTPYGILKWSIEQTRRICHKNAFLYLICCNIKPRVVVETGVAAGASSAYILKALVNNGFGNLYSIDLPNVEYINAKKGKTHNDNLPTNAQSGFAIPQELRSKWVLTLGDSRLELPNLLNKVEEVDLFFHDSLHTYDAMLFEYETVWPHIKRGGVLVSDDVTWNGAFEEFVRKKGVTSQIYHDRGLVIKA